MDRARLGLKAGAPAIINDVREWCCWGGLNSPDKPQKWLKSNVFDRQIEDRLYFDFVL
jgi:hypothetical protein